MLFLPLLGNYDVRHRMSSDAVTFVHFETRDEMWNVLKF